LNPRPKITLSNFLNSYRKIILITLGFLVALFIGNRVVLFTCHTFIQFDCPKYWPISIFMLRTPEEIAYPTITDISVAFFTCLILVLAVWVLRKKKYSLFWIILFGIILILGSNFVHGWKYGFVRPIDGLPFDKNQYYQDAISKVENPIDFLSNFTSLLPSLHSHTQTHPPGAVLSIAVLEYVLRPLGPGGIGIAIAVITTILTAFSMKSLLLTEFENETSGYLTFLLLLVPAIQIYYAASVDALIASCYLCALAFFVDKKWRFSIVLAVIFLFAASFLNYLFIFLLPIFAGYEWLVRRSLKRTIIVILSLVSIYAIIYFATGFNYVTAFRLSFSYESSLGFPLFSSPVNYFVTRLEDISEILLFFGPFMILAAFYGLRRPKKDQNLLILSWLAIATLLFIFLAGIFRTGETARSTLFIYPFLVLPVGYYIRDQKLSNANLIYLLGLVFAQTIIMQIIGDYFW
jgi:hypothetical protein